MWDERALRINEHIIELDEQNVGARTRLAKYYLDAGNVDEAGRLYEETLTLEPNNRIARNTLDRLARERESGASAEIMDAFRVEGGHRGSVGPRRFPTPNDVAAARRYFETLYPDDANRRRALGAMVETIRQIDRANILALGLTVRPTWTRFNVGRVGWRFFERTEIYLIVQDRALPHLTAAQKERVQPSVAEFASLRSLPTQGFSFAKVPLDGFDDIWGVLKESHFWVVRELARQVSRTPYYKSHSSGATAYMQEFLGVDVPDPEH